MADRYNTVEGPPVFGFTFDPLSFSVVIDEGSWMPVTGMFAELPFCLLEQIPDDSLP
jgi:hypothetical protein